MLGFLDRWLQDVRGLTTESMGLCMISKAAWRGCETCEKRAKGSKCERYRVTDRRVRSALISLMCFVVPRFLGYLSAFNLASFCDLCTAPAHLESPESWDTLIYPIHLYCVRPVRPAGVLYVPKCRGRSP
jgi:hypothetical protein